jgi:hypothetical protein
MAQHNMHTVRPVPVSRPSACDAGHRQAHPWPPSTYAASTLLVLSRVVSAAPPPLLLHCVTVSSTPELPVVCYQGGFSTLFVMVLSMNAADVRMCVPLQALVRTSCWWQGQSGAAAISWQQTLGKCTACRPARVPQGHAWLWAARPSCWGGMGQLRSAALTRMCRAGELNCYWEYDF